jgi:hypothetical protein
MSSFISKVYNERHTTTSNANFARRQEVEREITEIKISEHEELFKLFPMIGEAYSNFISKAVEVDEQIGPELAIEAKAEVNNRLLDLIELWDEYLKAVAEIWGDQPLGSFGQAQLALADTEKQQQFNEAVFGPQHDRSTRASYLFGPHNEFNMVNQVHSMEDFINEASAVLVNELESASGTAEQ